MIKIDGILIPTPSDYIVGVMDLSKAERNANGLMIIERIATKRKIEMSWKYLDKYNISQLFSLVSPVFFKVDFINPQTNLWENGTFYCGDRNAGALDYVNGNIRYKDIKFNIIER